MEPQHMMKFPTA